MKTSRTRIKAGQIELSAGRSSGITPALSLGLVIAVDNERLVKDSVSTYRKKRRRRKAIEKCIDPADVINERADSLRSRIVLYG